MKKVLFWEAIWISSAFAIVTLSIAYCQVDDDKTPQESTEGNKFFLIPPSFVKTAQNRDKIG